MNIADQPTYFISLKDNAGLVKAYSFVSVADYQIVGVGDTLEDAQDEYIRLLGSESTATETEAKEAVGTIEQIASAVKDGNSYYYIRLQNDDTVYIASIQISDLLPILQPGEGVLLEYTQRDDGFRDVTSLTRVEETITDITSSVQDGAGAAQ